VQRIESLLVFVSAGMTLGAMSDTRPDPTSVASPLRRRPWTTPQLVVHASMMVMTQHFFGAPAQAMMLQGVGISCVVGSGVTC
jgi:hypothetical protein